MNKRLAVLTNKPLRQIHKAVAELEERTGHRSEDVRLLAESLHALRKKTSQLGLDPDDTTGEELYHALLARFDRDCAAIDRALGVDANAAAGERVKKAIELVEHSVELDEIWTLKKSVVKKLIKDNPPRQLMKKLHYRSVDSLLKREEVRSVLTYANLTENFTWHKKTAATVSKFGSAEYELRKPSIILVDENLSTHFKEEVVVNQNVGTVAVAGGKMPVLSAALLIIESLEKLNENKVSHKLHLVHPALSWWSGTEHLLMHNDSRPVSLNLRDVAKNHFAKNRFSNRTNDHAHAALWAELMSRYKQHVDELPNEFAAVEEKARNIFQPVPDLALELAEI